MQTTKTLKQVSVGTELNIVQEGLPAVISAEACYFGWQESLTLLAKLVEAEIPDEHGFAQRTPGGLETTGILPPGVPRPKELS
jgi:hypothetical protein